MQIDQDLKQLINSNPKLSKQLEYALFPGKRLRGSLLLTLIACQDQQICSQAIAAASAIEITHAFSLVHDDMPALDNAEFRRGRPSFFKEFGESNALLIGDMLQYLAIHHIKKYPKLAMLLVEHAKDMVYGQWLESNCKINNLALLQEVQNYKTARLFQLTEAMASVITGVDKLNLVGLKLGQCLQWLDDIADVTEDEQGTNVLHFISKVEVIEKIECNLSAIRQEALCWPKGQLMNMWLQDNFDSALNKMVYND